MLVCMPERLAPHLVINPADDSVFRDAVGLAASNGADTTEELQAVLRTAFPLAVVRARSLEGETSIVWYVYRDGHWVRRATRE